eukprot:gene1192-2320_t
MKNNILVLLLTISCCHTTESKNSIRANNNLTIIECPTPKVQAISRSRLNTMIAAIADHICTEGGGSYDGDRKCIETNTVDLAPQIGGVLRLSFHDAVTYNNTDGSSGPDGCLNFNSRDNIGLSEIWFGNSKPSTKFILFDLYRNYFSSFSSKADFWALASNVAVLLANGPDIYDRKPPSGSLQKPHCTCVGTYCDIITHPNANTSYPCIAFHFGRKDAFSCLSDEGRLPDSQLDHTHIKDVFTDRLGFTPREIVALMGAHSVGRATLDESQIGFTNAEVYRLNKTALNNPPSVPISGAWSDTPDQFTTDFYDNMLSMSWLHDTHTTLADGFTPFYPPAKTFQWSNNKQALLMLNTDLSLIWDIHIDPRDPVQISCKGGHNPLELSANNTNTIFNQCSESTSYYPYVISFSSLKSNKNTATEMFFAAWVNAFTKMQELGYGFKSSTSTIKGKKGMLHTVTDASCI